MPRRVTLPGADELFRSTGSRSRDAAAGRDSESGPGAIERLAVVPDSVDRAVARRPMVPDGGGQSTGRQPTGRERHAEKITVYVSDTELVDLERARLTLRANHGLAVDRGRIVREALAVVLADLEAKGDDSILTRRLTGR